MPTIDLKDLSKYVNQMAKQAMNKGNNVKKVVIAEGEKQVEETVYQSYTPNQYERTGLLKKSWKAEETADGIAVYNDRRDGNKNVSEIVETGQGYQYEFDYNGVPRPFTENTRKALDGSSKLTNALKQDMKSLGADIE